MTKRRTIAVGALARVEGGGALTIKLRGREVEEVSLRIFEPPRFFEAFLRGRSQMEVPDITARICGICPVAYQMSSCRAIEDALGIAVGGALRDLRRLLYCGEWIESHALHVFLLHAPDFLGYEDALAMAKDHPEVVKRGLAIKKAGNAIMTLLGGRAVHPVNVRVGGFYRTPARSELDALLPELGAARDLARDAVAWLAKLPFADVEHDYEFVALRHEREYPMNEGRIVSSRGLDIEAREYDAHFREEQVPHSTALHSLLEGREYLCGPLARFNLNHERLSDAAREAALAAGLRPPCRNPFRSIVVRAVEVLFALDEAVRLIEGYEPPERPHVDVPARAATGFGCTEAPRGLLYHRYRVDENGIVLDAKIVPPTSQNQRAIESDLRRIGPRLADMPRGEATRLAEQTVRNHDPCISCATHFLRLDVERGSE